jgi:hypothetical protein
VIAQLLVEFRVELVAANERMDPEAKLRQCAHGKYA